MSVKCREEINTNLKGNVEQKETCNSKNLEHTLTSYISTQKIKADSHQPISPRQHFTGTDMQPILSTSILPNQNASVKSKKEATSIRAVTDSFIHFIIICKSENDFLVNIQIER